MKFLLVSVVVLSATTSMAFADQSTVRAKPAQAAMTNEQMDNIVDGGANNCSGVLGQGAVTGANELRWRLHCRQGADEAGP